MLATSGAKVVNISNAYRLPFTFHHAQIFAGYFRMCSDRVHKQGIEFEFTIHRFFTFTHANEYELTFGVCDHEAHY